MSVGNSESGTRLNSIISDEQGGVYVPDPGDDSAGDPDLDVHEVDLRLVAENARGLRLQLSKGYAATGHSQRAGADLTAGGLDSGRVLRHSAYRFFRRAMSLRADCQRIEDHLNRALSAHAGHEVDAIGEFRRPAGALSDGNDSRRTDGLT